jgi:hypothetical protein
MEKDSKLGLLCLIAAIALIAIVNFAALLALGFLYYAYKLLYKKEKPTAKDKIMIILLLALLLLEIFLMMYFTSNYLDLYGSTGILPQETNV